MTETKQRSLILRERYDLTLPERTLIKRGLTLAESLIHSIILDEFEEIVLSVGELLLLEESNDWQGILEFVKGKSTLNAHEWNMCGKAYYELKRYDEAIEACRRAIRINPEYTLAWAMLVACYCNLGNQNAALDAANELQRFEPAKANKLLREIKDLFNDNILE